MVRVVLRGRRSRSLAAASSQQPRSGRLTSSRGLIFDGASSAEQPLQAASQPTAAQPSQPPQPHCSIAPRTLRALSQCTVPLRAPRSVPRSAPSSVLTLSHTLSFGVCSACPPACCTRSVSRAVPRVVLWLSVALSLVLSLALSCVSVALCPPLHPRRAVPLASRVRARSVRSAVAAHTVPPSHALALCNYMCTLQMAPLPERRTPARRRGLKRSKQKAYQKAGAERPTVGG